MVKALYFQSSGWTNNCQIEVPFKWLDQSCTPSTAPVYMTNYIKCKGPITFPVKMEAACIQMVTGSEVAVVHDKINVSLPFP